MKKFAIKVPFSKAEAVANIKNRFRDLNCEHSKDEIIISYPIWYRNDFAPHLYLKLMENGNETTITGQVKMRTWVRIFCYVWFSLLGLTTIAIFNSTLSEVNRSGKSYTEFQELLYPIGMMIFMFGLIKFGAFIARNNTESILDMFFRTFPNHIILEDGQ